jgi:hypothetical protein
MMPSRQEEDKRIKQREQQAWTFHHVPNLGAMVNVTSPAAAPNQSQSVWDKQQQAPPPSSLDPVDPPPLLLSKKPPFQKR